MAPVPFLSVKFDGQSLDPLVRAVTVEDNDRLVDEATLTFEDPDGKGADLFAADKTLTVELGWDDEHAVLFEGLVVDRHPVAGADGEALGDGRRARPVAPDEPEDRDRRVQARHARGGRP